MTVAMSTTRIILATLALATPALAQCPITCPKMQYESSSCSDNTTTCFIGPKGGAVECHLPQVHVTTQRVFIEGCTLKNLSRSSLVNLRGTAISSFNLLQVKIESLAGDLFTDLPHLREFHLKKSYDVDFRNLSKALGSIQAKQNVTVTLEGMGVTDENITEIFSQANPSRIVSLSLANNVIERLRLSVLQTWTSLQMLNLTGNKISQVLVDAPSKPLVNLKSLLVYGNRLSHTSIWQKLSLYLPNLEELDLGENQITELKKFAIIPWTSLKTLLLTRNAITYLNFENMLNLTSLERLDMSYNWLSNISRSSQMKSMKVLKLSRNEYSNFPPWFCQTSNGAYRYSLLPQLEVLDLSFNLIRITWNQAWSCLSKLKSLNLNGNPLSYIQNNTFTGLSSLEELYLSDNMNGGLERVEPEAFNNINIKHLELQSNGIIFEEKPRMLHIFKRLTNLRFLNLARNKLDRLTDTNLTNLLSPLINIEFLNLTWTDIDHLPNGLLGNFTNLTTLILAKNKFEGGYLKDSFNSAVNLEYLSLSQNWIHVVPKDSFVGSIQRTLKKLDLTMNPFECSCRNLWFRNMIDASLNSKSCLRLTDWPEKYCCKTMVPGCEQPLKDYHPTKKECEPLDPIVIAFITIASFVVVFSVTACFVFRFRWHIKYWAYKMNRTKRASTDPETQPLIDHSQQYDAYIIYSNKDTDVHKFIKESFNPMMEGFGYHLFLFDRDAGTGANVSEIGDGIYGSRHVIALVTSCFLRDTWCKFQMEVAMDREVKLQREFLMFVVLDDVEVKLLSNFWCARFTKTPTARWCSDRADVRRKALDALIKRQLGDPGPKNMRIQ